VTTRHLDNIAMEFMRDQMEKTRDNDELLRSMNA